MADERVHLAQGQWHGRPALQVPAEKAIGRHAELEGRLGGLLDDGRAVFLGQRQHAEDPADARRAVVLMDRFADGVDVRARGARAPEQCQRRAWRARRPIVIVDPMPPAWGAQMLTQELAGFGCQEADVQIVPLDLDAPADPAGRRAVVRGLDLHTAVEMHRALAVAVIPKRLERERAQGGLLFGKHDGDLPLRGAMDPRVSPARLPAIQVRLRRLEALEAQSSQRCFLRVADARFDLAFPIGIGDAARERDDPIVRKHVAIERIQRGVIDVGRQDALFQIVQDDDADGATESAKCAFVQLGPHLRARPPHEQPHRFAGVAERQDEEPRASVLARDAIAHHRPGAVIHLAFVPGGGGDDDARVGGRAATLLRDKTSDTGVAGGEAVIVDQVLPDGHRVAATTHRFGNQLPVRLAGAGARRATRRGRPRRRRSVGGHLPCGGRC